MGGISLVPWPAGKPDEGTVRNYLKARGHISALMPHLCFLPNWYLQPGGFEKAALPLLESLDSDCKHCWGW